MLRYELIHAAHVFAENSELHVRRPLAEDNNSVDKLSTSCMTLFQRCAFIYIILMVDLLPPSGSNIIGLWQALVLCVCMFVHGIYNPLIATHALAIIQHQTNSLWRCDCQTGFHWQYCRFAPDARLMNAVETTARQWIAFCGNDWCPINCHSVDVIYKRQFTKSVWIHSSDTVTIRLILYALQSIYVIEFDGC